MKHRMGIEVNAVEIGKPVTARPLTADRAGEPVARRPVQRCEWRDLGIEGIECPKFVVPHIDQDRRRRPRTSPQNRPADRRRMLEARERQCADDGVSKRIMQRRRASARSVEADLPFGLKHHDLGVLQSSAAADTPAIPPPITKMSAVLATLRRRLSSRSFTTLPPGSAGVPERSRGHPEGRDDVGLCPRMR